VPAMALDLARWGRLTYDTRTHGELAMAAVMP
jgi:hypothetical protein